MADEMPTSIASYDPNDPLNWYLRNEDNARDGKRRRLVESDELMDSAIEQILNVRGEIQPSDGSLPSSGNGGKMDVCPTEYIFSIPPRDIDWMPVTLPDYYRMYIAVGSTKSAEQQRMRGQDSCGGSSGLCWQESSASRPRRHLLATPFEELLATAEKINEAERRRVAALRDHVAAESNNWEVTTTADKEDLWSSKYQPRAYIDLLSDDGANRTLLTWLKLWDHCVFGKKVKRTGTMTDFVKFEPKPLHHEGRRQQETNADTLSRRLDAHGRPEFKIALLSGPPGIGKTTLAHTVARQCGYHIQEINASDDRTMESFNRLLKGALQMKRTLGANPKPHCVIVDEVDGAPAPSVNYLVALARSGTNKKARSTLLRRPIICICNDLYAPALRELRRIALVLHVPPLETHRLTERLLQICTSEEISVELSVLRALCRKTNNDIRSCINTLQFLSCSDCAIQHGDVERVTFGLKDSKKSLFDVWADVFRLPRLKRLHDCAGPTSENRYIDARCETVLTAVARCEQEDRLFDGLFENYPLIQFKDRHLRAIRSGLCWIEFMDHLNRWINENQLFELLAYRRYVAVAFHLLFASGNFAKLNYPQQQKDVTIRIDRNAAMLQSLLSDLSTEIRSAIDRSDLITDVLPFLLQIVQPEIKSSNPQLYTPREWSAFRNAARVMAQYNITYRQQRSADGSFQAVMEPPLEDVALFAVDMPFRPTLSYNARQAIAREAQLTRLSAIGDHTARKGEAPPPPPSKSKTANKEASANRAEAPRSFLARRTARRSVPLPFAIEFKFQSGSDCVIRRRIRVRDLL
uniref:AAA domain-containing protein n=1 Tax=Trichuris muris TaxID=70415 RepID=A0A5S6QY50_TRIMR